VVIRELFVALGLDVDEAGFAAANLYAEGVKKAFGLLEQGLHLVVEGLNEVIFGTAEAGDHIKELSERTGVNAQELQKLAYGAQQSGVEMDQLALAMNFLAKKGVKDVQGEMLKLADQLQGMPHDGSRAALAMEKFGRAGGALVPYLSKGREEIERLGQEAEASGKILSQDALDAADQFSDSMDALKGSVQGIAYTIGVPLIKALKPLIQGLTKWIISNRKLISSKVDTFVENLTYALELAGPAFRAIGTFIGWLLERMDHLVPILAIVGTAFAIFWAVSLGPALAVIAAIGAVILIIEDLWTWLEGGDSVFGDLLDAANNTLPALWDAAWERTKQFFDDTLNIGRMAWFALKMGVIDAFNNAVISVKQIFMDLWSWLKTKASEIGPALLQGIVSGAASLLSFLPGGAAIGAAAGITSSLFGGGSSPAASSAAAAGASGPAVVAPSLTSPVTINAYAGQDPQAIANAVMEQHKRMMESLTAEAYEAAGG
jgi:hypothetical protein